MKTKLSLAAVLTVGALVSLAPMTRAADDAAPAAPAAGQGRRQGGAQNPQAQAARMEKMADDMKLTGEKKEKFLAAMKERGEKTRALGQDLSREDRQAKMKEISEATNKKVEALLDTAEQKEVWAKAQTQMQQRRPRPAAAQ